METTNIDYLQTNFYASNNAEPSFSEPIKKNDDSLELFEEEIKKSSVQVSISMNAQIVLFSMDSSNYAEDNTSVQNDIFGFLSGKKIDESNYSLEELGYDGKPITQLSQDEAKSLINEEGFFGIEETSKRVSQFVFDFAGYDLNILEKGREGIIHGFEEANKLWKGKLPEISYRTQEKTLALIDARISDLKAKQEKQ